MKEKKRQNKSSLNEKKNWKEKLQLDWMYADPLQKHLILVSFSIKNRSENAVKSKLNQALARK